MRSVGVSQIPSTSVGCRDMSRRRIWTPDQIDVLRANFANMSTKEMVALINDPKIGISQVNAKGSELGLKKSKEILNRSYAKNMNSINSKKKLKSSPGVVKLVKYRVVKSEKPMTPEEEEKDREKFNKWYYSDRDITSKPETSDIVHHGGRY